MCSNIIILPLLYLLGICYHFLFYFGKKNALVTTTEAPDSQAVANGEFKRKLEYFVS